MRLLPLLFLPALVPAQSPPTAKAILEGDVVDAATGAPIAGARIKLQSQPAEPLYTRTDEKGHFVFRDLDPLSYGLYANSPGFLPLGYAIVDFRPLPPFARGRLAGAVVSQYGGRSAGKVERSTGSDGAPRATATLRLTAAAAIAGKVTDPYGLPMAEAMIELVPRETPTSSVSPPRRQIQTNDKGEYRFAGLDPGAYYVAVNKTNSRGNWDESFRITWYPDATDQGSAQPISLSAGQQARADIQVVRRAGVRVAGRVILPPEISSGARVYTNVLLEPQGSPLLNPNGPFTSAAQSEYALNDVLPGKYNLMALTRDLSDPLASPQKPLAGYMRPIEVGDRDLAGVDVALVSLRDLPGSVAFSEGCAPTPLRIVTYARSQLAGGQAEATAGPDGKFVLSGITTGHVTVQVTSLDGTGMLPRVSSIRLGGRDVQKDGFDAPWTGNDPLKITIGCYSGRPR